ncbi:hypothetical protein BDV39DRAFT_178325 [Aspergillus sergii]|uniref:Uncharacterized protein n=1 Tax=Aspergillus sergii TaxID=1034303 RepID=A0A5N6WXZ1_9EURO|nr:hypothetical protein BDV39DRAFT_178325 [Aspergillus sergii]
MYAVTDEDQSKESDSATEDMRFEIYGSEDRFVAVLFISTKLSWNALIMFGRIIFGSWS